MKIQSLQLKNFRCFEDVKIDFDERLTVLVGVNGSGKSTVLDAVAPALQCATKKRAGIDKDNLLTYRSADFTLNDIHKNNVQTLPEFIITIDDFGDTTDYIVPLLLDVNNDLVDKKNEYFDKIYNKYKKPCTDTVRSLFVFYKAKRLVDSSQDKKLKAKSSLESAFENATNPTIDVPASLAWFTEKDAQDARYIRENGKKGYFPDYEAVREAIAQALGDYENPHMEGTPEELVVYKKGDASKLPHKFFQLSDGYRTMLALIMDLARRMAVANADIYAKENKSVLHSPAIVLIDEVELHLHPSWQQRVLPDLMRIFPNTQFIVTTHSPQVLTSIPSECIRILKNGKVNDAPFGSQGAESSRVLKRILGVDSRPPLDPVTQNLEEYKKLVYADKWESDRAKELRMSLDIAFADEDPALTELDLYIDNRKWELGQ